MTVPLPLVATGFWLLAFICSFPWVSVYEAEFLMASLSLLFVAMSLNDGAGIAKRQWFVPRSSVLLAGATFWLVAGISVVASDILFISWIYFFFLSALPLTIIFFLVGDDFDCRLSWAWSGLRILLGALSLYALCQYFFLPKLLFQGRVHEPLADPNSLAAIFSLGTFLIAGNLLKKTPRVNWWNAGLFFLLVAALFTTGSRGALLAMTVMALAFVASVGIKQIGKRNWLTLGGIGAVALAVIGVLYTPTDLAGPIKLLSYSYHQVGLEKVFGERGLIWATTLDLVKAHPWFGTGPGTFTLYYPELKSPADGTAGYMVHNDPLHFAAEMGVFSTLLFYTVCLLALVRTWKAVKVLPAGDDRRFDILAPLFGLGALVFHSHLTFNFHVLPCLFLAGFAFAAWYRATSLVLAEPLCVIRAPRLFNDLALKTIFLVVAFVMITMVSAPLYSQVLVDRADKDLSLGRVEDFAYKVNLADTLSLGTNAEAYALAANVPLGILDQKEHPVSDADRTKFKAQIREMLAKGEHANPRKIEILVQKAQLASLEGDDALAETYLRDAVRMDPIHIPARIALGAQLEKNGKPDEAMSVMDGGLVWKYSPSRAGRYMEYLIKTMDMKEAREKEQGGAKDMAPDQGTK